MLLTRKVLPEAGKSRHLQQFLLGKERRPIRILIIRGAEAPVYSKLVSLLHGMITYIPQHLLHMFGVPLALRKDTF